jgi:serine/threonine protein kinase
MTERDIFIEALGRPAAAERGEFLARACAGSDDLRRRVESLLREHDRLGSFLEGPAVELPATIDPDPAASKAPPAEPPRPGAAVGPYRLLEVIGEGGMGTVWRAEQTEPVRREVALKVVRAGMDGRSVLARFEAERQALALMDHPNIARVLDAGATADGRPYFVMELVKGVPITEFCDRKRLAPKERLGLFVQVCQAVQHAHQKGVIHRDLKPSNVLVREVDGRPVPKVIDFGVAKAAGQKLTEKTLVTGFGAIVGTPEYMSPEQAEPTQLDIDTRTDVYSLGVLLYELLTGTTPVTRKRLKEAALLEVLRVIREEEPPKPSTRLSSTDELPSIAASRSLEPRKLTGLVKGELDWIVMRALEKDRNRRYDSANAFAADVQRYLADEPVLAGPPSAAYRLRKFARRHRGPVLAAAAVLLVLVGGIVGTTAGMLQARQARAAAELAEENERGQRLRAQQNLGEALRAVDQMLTRVAEGRLAGLPHMDPVRRALLEDALQFYLRFLRDNGADPTVRLETGRAYVKVGILQLGLGRHEEARAAYDRGIALLEELTAAAPDVPEYRRRLAHAYHNRGDLLRVVGPPRDAEQAYRRAVDLLRAVVAEAPGEPDYRHELANSHNALGTALRDTGRPGEAEQEFLRAAALAEPLAAAFPARTEYRKHLALNYLNAAMVQGMTVRRREAEANFARGIATAEQVARESPQDRDYETVVADGHAQFGRFLMESGRSDEAEKELKKALTLLQKLTDDFPSRPDYRKDLAECHGILGALCYQRGRPDETARHCEEDCKLHRKLAEDFPAVAAYQSNCGVSLSNYSILLSNQGNLGQARAYLEEAIRRQQAALKINPKNPGYSEFLGRHYVNLAIVLSALKAPGEEEAVRQAVEVNKRLATDYPDVPEYQTLLGGALRYQATLYVARGQPAEAAALLKEAVACNRAAVQANPSHPGYRQELNKSCKDLIPLLQRAGRGAEVEAVSRQWIELLEELAGQRPNDAGAQSDLGAALSDLAALLLGAGRAPAEARGLLERAVTHQQAALKQAPTNATYRRYLGHHYYILGVALSQMKNFAEADQAYRRCLEARQKLAADFPDNAAYQADLAAAEARLAELAAAKPAK